MKPKRRTWTMWALIWPDGTLRQIAHSRAEISFKLDKELMKQAGIKIKKVTVVEGGVVTIDELKQKLRGIAARGGLDPEPDHSEADDLLLEFINDPEVKEIYDSIDKWYS